MQKVRALILNKRERALKKLNKGDFVKNYVPPSHEEAQTRKRKAKRILQFRGPLNIVEKPSDTTFKLASQFNSKKNFRRHISNMSRWNGPIPDKRSRPYRLTREFPNPPQMWKRVILY